MDRLPLGNVSDVDGFKQKSSQKKKNKIQNLERLNFLPGNILQIYVEAILCAFKAQARNDVGMA